MESFKNHRCLLLWTLLGSLALTSCSTLKFTGHPDGVMREGKSDTVRTMNGIDYWEGGLPTKDYRVLGVIDYSHLRQSLPAITRNRMIADTAKQHGGDGVILGITGSQLAALEPDLEDPAGRARTSAIVVKYPSLPTVAQAAPGQDPYFSGFDYPKMLELAKEGDPGAQVKLGAAYFAGHRVQPDFREAAKWFRRAANQGSAAGQFALGWLYETGQGVPRDPREAVEWFYKAADRGMAAAQYKLGAAYTGGIGVTQDNIEAYAWWSIAASNGSKDAANQLTQLAGKLTPQDLAEANKRAAEHLERPASSSKASW